MLTMEELLSLGLSVNLVRIPGCAAAAVCTCNKLPAGRCSWACIALHAVVRIANIDQLHLYGGLGACAVC